VEDADPGVSLNLVINKKINPEDFRGLITRGTRITYDVPAALAEASLYVHPSRGDIFPVAPLEAMLAGLPAIVSDETGTKEIVEKVDADYVVPLEPGKIAERILAHFGLSDRKKAALSKKFRDATKPFNEKEQVGLFRKRYNGLIRELR
jgi:glycosyltransferase involved in cell wall biosynthesis